MYLNINVKVLKENIEENIWDLVLSGVLQFDTKIMIQKRKKNQ